MTWHFWPSGSYEILLKSLLIFTAAKDDGSGHICVTVCGLSKQICPHVRYKAAFVLFMFTSERVKS